MPIHDMPDTLDHPTTAQQDTTRVETRQETRPDTPHAAPPTPQPQDTGETPSSAHESFNTLLRKLFGRPGKPERTSAAPERGNSDTTAPPAQPGPAPQTADQAPGPAAAGPSVQPEHAPDVTLDHERQRRLAEIEKAKTDPFGYAEQKAAELAAEEYNREINNLLKETIKIYDDFTITPILEELPDHVRTDVLKHNKPGLEGRRALLNAAIKALKEHAEKEAREKLRKDKAFRKELLAELRSAALEHEPDFIEGTQVSRTSFNMTEWMRRQLGK